MTFSFVQWSVVAAVIVFGVIATGEEKPSKTTDAQFKHCLVSLIEDLQIAAQVPGLLMELTANEGQQIEVGAVVGRIDDAASQLQKDVAIAERAISQEKATNDINVRYAEATRRVAAAEYQLNSDANTKVPGTKSHVELQQLLLAVEQAALQIEQARHEQKLAELETGANTSKVRLTENDIRLRQVISPIKGEVVEVLINAGEWVNPGDVVLRIIRMDRLRVEAFAKATEYAPGELIGRPVRVKVELAHKRLEVFSGRVVFIDPRVQAGGDYRLWTEVENRMESGQWLLRPGFEAEMLIDTEGRVGT